MSESNPPDNRSMNPPDFGDIEEKGPKSGVRDRQGGRVDRKPYSTRGAEQATPEDLSRRTQNSLVDAFTSKIEISDLLDPIANDEDAQNSLDSELGSPIPIAKGVYIYTRDPENPDKLNLVGINTKFSNARTIIQLENPYAEEELEVISIFYNKNQSVKGRARFIVLPDGKGGLKHASE